VELSPPLHHNSFVEYGGETPTLEFDDGAQRLRDELETKHLEMARSFELLNKKLAVAIIKYEGYFGRLCVLFHCIEHANEKSLPPVITENTARQVAEFLHGFLFKHAVAFYCGVLGMADEHDRLTAVAGYILAHKKEVITNRDIQRGTRTMRSLTKRETDAVFEQFEALGWLAPIERKGKPTIHWDVNQEVHIRFTERAKQEAANRDTARKLFTREFWTEQKQKQVKR
jgi:hypothetical protein